jgi:subtilisin family serine protease
MNRRLFPVMAAILITLTGAEAAQKERIPPEVRQKAQAEGAVRVLVEFDIRWQPEVQLSPQAALAQRQAIAKAQDALLAELAGTKHRVTARFQLTPGLGLEVGPGALAVLEHSTLVSTVREERIDRPFLSQSVPLIGGSQTGGFDGTGWVVAVLDTGVDKNHPFFKNKVVAEACFSQGSNCPSGSTQMIGPGAAVPCTYEPSGPGSDSARSAA